MAQFFSRRHRDGLRSKRLQPSFPNRLRITLGRILGEFSEWDNWGTNDSFLMAEQLLKKFYGQNELTVRERSGEYTVSGLDGLVQEGYPSQVLDALEAWFETKPGRAREAEFEMNEAFERWDSPWRIINGRAILLDSGYLQTEVVASTLRLLDEVRAYGALEEFQAAVEQLRTGDIKAAVVNAHKSVESVMKVVLETDDNLRFGQLLEAVIKSGILPEYYESFIRNFREVLIGVSKERNRPAGAHGQGRQPTEISETLGEFALHLAGAVDLFLLRSWIQARPEPTGETAPPEVDFSDEDVPF